MTAPPPRQTGDPLQRLFVYNGGFLTKPRIRRILALSGYRVTLGLPGKDQLVGVWGKSATARRGEAIAARTGAQVLRVEDAWLRSLYPGARTPPLGLTIDTRGVHYDPSCPSDLETLLATHPLDDTALLDRARGAIACIREAHLTKYSAVDPALEAPAPGYVLVIDQTADDASVTACGADRNRFLEMLFEAHSAHPGARIVIKSHPATLNGARLGYFLDGDLAPHITRVTAPLSPWTLFEGAVAVYTVSSQLGFEALLAGHRPNVFGQPFYAGWGLTQDAFPVQRRQRSLTRAQLFAGAALIYPKWYSPYHNRLCSFEESAHALAAEARAWREDRAGWIASGISAWKRTSMQRFFGTHKPVLFHTQKSPSIQSERRRMVWASKASGAHDPGYRVEDGFLRSNGLGAELVPPLSLVCDDLGIYYDATRPSRLESLIAARAHMRPDQARRARALIKSLTEVRISKYNLPDEGIAPLGPGAVLVVGQVEDDASIRFGTSDIATNEALLRAARAARPDAPLYFKPHPDVAAGLRNGGSAPLGLADHVLGPGSITSQLTEEVEVWTMTSLLGFEALLRGARVVTLGAPFYAGWALTEDRGTVPSRRDARPTLEGLVHAALIDYPRYRDPVTGAPCPVEVAVARLAAGAGAQRGPALRLLSKLQGMLAGHASLWRGRC